MNVVDSSGWLEYLTDGPNADYFATPIEDEENLATPTICIYEVCKRMLLDFGEERALAAAGILTRGVVIELNQHDAIDAARLSIQLKLAMADSIILATARASAATLWTQDAHFRELEYVQYIDKKS